MDDSHYKRTTIEAIDVIESWGLNFSLGCVIKYIARHRFKGGTEDLRKALWYLERQVRSSTPESTSPRTSPAGE